MILTFYSYKGGVGRSMALANVADTLARQGLRVLMIDFDLEAPGLEQFFPINHNQVRAHSGLVDLLLSYKQAMSQASSAGLEQSSFRQLKDLFIVPVYDQLPSGGRLDLLPAGQRGDEEQLANYALSLRTFDWQDFYFNWAGELFFDWLRRTLNDLYDLVLVDSRTGVTEMGGICAYQLADSIAMFCASNQQNLHGTLNVIQNFYSPRVQMLRRNRPLQLLVVPSRVEQRDNPLLEDFNQRFTQAFASFTPPELLGAELSFWDLAIPYEPHYAFKEQVVVRSETGREAQVSAAYRQLVEAITLIADANSPVGKLRSDGSKPKAIPAAQYDITRTQAGYDLFLCYHPEDAAAVEQFCEVLVDIPGGAALFNPLAIMKGTSWQAAVEHALDESRGCMVFLGPSPHAPWENEELRALIEKRITSHRAFQVFPVLLPGAKSPDPERVPAFLSGKRWHDLRSGFATELLAETFSTAVAEPPFMPGSSKQLANPYRGLDAFHQQDAALFYGREPLVRQALEQLQSSSALFIIGPSGSGKSSLVNAGLVPALRAGALPGSENWRFASLRPGSQPLESLGELLAQLVEGTSFDLHTTSELTASLQRDKRLLLRVAETLGMQSKGSRLALVVDPLEEVWSLVDTVEERRVFLDHLIEAVQEPGTPYLIIFVLRSDYYAEAASLRRLSDLMQRNQLLVSAMGRDELRQAIVSPAQTAGVAFEPGLPELILDEVEGQPGALPLMQFVLQLLWERQSQGFLTVKAYKSIGGLGGALGQQADHVLLMQPADEQELTRNIFMRLVSWDKDEILTRRRVRFSELVPAGGSTSQIEAVLQRYIDARLLVAGTVEDSIGDSYVEIAHDVLIRSWPRLLDWLSRDREVLLALRELGEHVREWQAQRRNPSFLYRGARLQQAEAQAAMYANRLNSLELEFLKVSRMVSDRQRRRVLWIGIATALVIVMLAVFGLVQASLATQQAANAAQQAATAQAASTRAMQNSGTAQANANEASQQSEIALARQLAAQSQSVYSVAGKGRLLSALLAIESLQRLPSIEGFQSLQRGLIGLPQEVSSFNSESAVLKVALSPDGQTIAAGTQDGTVYLLAATGQETIRSNPTAVNHLSFSPDGKYLASGSQDGVIRVWDLADLKAEAVLYKQLDQTDPALPAIFTPDGKFLISVSQDGALTALDLVTLEQGTVIEGSGRILAYAINTDVRSIVLANEDGMLALMDIDLGKELASAFPEETVTSIAISPGTGFVVVGSEFGTLTMFESGSLNELWRTSTDSAIVALSFSPDGRFYLSGHQDGTIQVWNAVTGASITQMRHDAELTSMAVSPDGNYVVSGSKDGTARVWEIATGLEILRMTHDGPVNSVAFSPDGKKVVSASEDGSVRTWNLSSTQEAVAVMELERQGGLWTINFSPDGKWLASISGEVFPTITAQVWEALTGLEVARFERVIAVQFTSDNTQAIIGTIEGTVYIWDSATRKFTVIRESETPIAEVAFSPDGRFVASSAIGVVEIRDISSKTVVADVPFGDGAAMMVFSPDGSKLFSSDLSRNLLIWDVINSTELARISQDAAVITAAFSPNGKYLVTGSKEGSVQVWNAETGQMIAAAKHNDRVRVVAFSPDGKHVLSASDDGTIIVLQSETEGWASGAIAPISQFSHDGPIMSAAFSPDGLYAISGSTDGTARVWEVLTGIEVARMTHDSTVAQVAFSPDGNYVVSGSNDGELRLWLWRVEDLIAEVCSRLPRNLTQEEWTQYLVDQPYRATCANLLAQP